MKGYSSANGDNRGILERFLPSTYRTTKDGSNAHNAFLGAIKGSIETTRDDMKDMSLQVYFTKATGKFLDLYGKYIGLSRNDNEEDQPYRDRIVKYIQTKRGTIEAIIDGIRNELGEPDLPVSIYETWRNIFIMNRSTLNGLDYVMGEKYRYAVIEITVGKYVEPVILTEIVERYKAYGVKVLYRYALGMSDEVWNNPVDFSQDLVDSDKTYSLVDYTSPYYEKATITLGDSPITEKDISLFKMNNSKLNGSDVVSGNPENAYIFDYTNSPSYHIIGYVDSNSNPKSGGFKDSYDYVYQGTKVDLSTVGGRNYLISGTSILGWLGDNNIIGHNGAQGVIYDYISTTAKEVWSYSVWSDKQYTVTSEGKYLRYALYDSNKQQIMRKAVGLNMSTDTAKGQIVVDDNSAVAYIRVEIDWVANGYGHAKLEKGNLPTDWTPAPEDTPKLYGYPFTTEPYLITSRKDNNGYEFKPSSNKSTVIGVNVSRYAINGGYENLISNYNSSSVTSVNIYTNGSEIGLPRTDLVVVGTDGKNISGKFNTNGNDSYVSDNSKSTGAYKFAFSSPKSVDSLTVTDYYNYGYSNRLITIGTPKIELPVGIFKGQTTGDIKLPDYSYPDKTFLVSSTNKFKLNIDSTAKVVMIYNYSSQSWENYDFGKYYEIGNYIEDANSIQGAYMLVKFTDSDFVLNYFDLEFETVTIPYTSDGSTYSNKLGQFVLDQSKLG